MRRFLFLLLTALFLLVTVSCLPQPFTRPWVYADLRWRGPADAPTPATDLLAVYTHSTALTVDIRLDLLDINPGDQYAIRLSLWDNNHFSKTPLVVDISANGAVQTTGFGDGRPVVWPRVIQDYELDTVSISLNRGLIGAEYHFDVSTYIPGSAAAADQALGIRSDGLTPGQRAPLLLEFWNTFPADTPAQALRRWDGAHTGPLGDRHGLVHVLQPAEIYHVPLALLDVRNPASLAALSYLEELWHVQIYGARGLFILPDVAYGEPADVAVNISRQSSAGFGISDSPFVYAASGEPVTGYPAQFVRLPDSSHLTKSGSTRFIPLPEAQAVEATADGPSLDVRRALNAVAFSPDRSDLIVLGGSLPDSTWGDPDMSFPTLQWIAAHPWIQPLTGDDLLTFPARDAYTPPVSPAADSSPWLTQLRAAPWNSITQSAWQVYLSLTAPTADVNLKALRAAYLGDVGELLAAARWMESPAAQANCSLDLDGDGRQECILSNRQFFAVLDPQGATLTNLFMLDGRSVHQLVGATSQFTVGLSDPSEWQPRLGKAADPTVIPGAFFDEDSTWQAYTPTVTLQGITFTRSDGRRIKTYQLTQGGIQVEYRAAGPLSTQIPLVVDPQTYYFQPVDYRPDFTPQVWTWSLLGGISVQVRTDATLTGQGFVSSYPFLQMPEDPNLDYPDGHYYPFPLAEVTIHGSGNFQAEISVESQK